jgi:hypothetical protein
MSFFVLFCLLHIIMESDALLVNDHLLEQLIVGLARSFHFG